jgi:hypothetical protein
MQYCIHDTYRSKMAFDTVNHTILHMKLQASAKGNDIRILSLIDSS